MVSQIAYNLQLVGFSVAWISNLFGDLASTVAWGEMGLWSSRMPTTDPAKAIERTARTLRISLSFIRFLCEYIIV